MGWGIDRPLELFYSWVQGKSAEESALIKSTVRHYTAGTLNSEVILDGISEN
jgi:hypothetical protein